ncbi:MAG: hypothetical protein KA473_12295 [Anaerolineales bacterium]|nr:hypothetical protein [Anaerolineales bacterium]MBP6210208.1 hypothetical protein [Anaerolineales bacterium]
MNKEIKNPFVAGLINVFVPGVSHLYVSKDWYRFITALVTNLFVLMVTVSTGVIAQETPKAALPQGVCMGILVGFFVVAMFSSGFSLARKNNASQHAFL